MPHSGVRAADRPGPEQVLAGIADYVCNYVIEDSEANAMARHCLSDRQACARLHVPDAMPVPAFMDLWVK